MKPNITAEHSTTKKIFIAEIPLIKSHTKCKLKKEREIQNKQNKTHLTNCLIYENFFLSNFSNPQTHLINHTCKIDIHRSQYQLDRDSHRLSISIQYVK